MRTTTRTRPAPASNHVNLGELVCLVHERARAKGLTEAEASEVTARAIGRALGLSGNRRLLGALCSD